jgi:hypothetical protein
MAVTGSSSRERFQRTAGCSRAQPTCHARAGSAGPFWNWCRPKESRKVDVAKIVVI